MVCWALRSCHVAQVHQRLSLTVADGAHNDSRMNVSLAMTAALYGATVVNHLKVTGLEKDATGKLNGARVKDLIPDMNGKTSKDFSIRAKVSDIYIHLKTC